MKLKTLKDICKVQPGQPKSNAILKEFEEELKQEAIKHVKELKKVEKRDYGYYCPRCEVGWSGENDFCWDCELKANWIKHFFNITEEDLK